MARKLTVAAAQTGPVFGGMQDGVEAACAMVKEGARKGVDIICFPEVFPHPFSEPADSGLREAFLTLPNPVTDPLFAVAREHKVMLVFGYAERDGAYFYNSAAVFDVRASGRHHRKTHIPAYFPNDSRRHGFL
jgi:predicted amidohydrolase